MLLYSSLPQAECSLLVSGRIKNTTDQCHYLKLHLEDKCGVAVDGLRSTEAGLHLGLWQTSQRALRALPSKEHSQGRSYKFSKDTKLRVVFIDLKNEADVNRTFKSDLTQ